MGTSVIVCEPAGLVYVRVTVTLVAAFATRRYPLTLNCPVAAAVCESTVVVDGDVSGMALTLTARYTATGFDGEPAEGGNVTPPRVAPAGLSASIWLFVP